LNFLPTSIPFLPNSPERPVKGGGWFNGLLAVIVNHWRKNVLSMTEQWKDIIGYEGLYQISNKARIKSLQRTVKKWSWL